MINYFTWTRRLWVAMLLLVVTAPAASAQFGFGFRPFGVVGGVSVDTDGVVRNLTMQERSDVLRQLRTAAQAPGQELGERVERRMVSLVQLQAAIAEALAEDRPLSDEVLYLAGLQRVEYVFVYPERNDIVLAGPAEPWTVRDDASVVGKFSGRPVLHLEDLLVALRTSEVTRHEVISVSIDPTPEGELRLQQLLATFRGGQFNPQAAEPAMKEAFGPQLVTLTAVPENSRMANTLVAADYEMKRIAMHLEPSPVRGLSSYMEMVRDGGLKQGVQPRWWITCDYSAILHSDDMLAWQITGSGIKALTEDQFIDASGRRTGTGSANKQAQKWADLFTAKYDELSMVNSAFGDLRNVMDLNLIATIIRAQDLQQRAGCDLALLFGTDDSGLETPTWQVPKMLHPQCSFIRGRSGWVVSASGGVEINPWRIASETARQDESVKAVRAQAQVEPHGDQRWWWN